MGAAKAGELVNKKKDAVLGQQAMDAFQASVPGLAQFREKTKNKWEETRRRFGQEWGHIRAIDGRILFVASAHTLLTAQLQSVEAITCKASAVYLDMVLNERKLPFVWLLHYHDELAVACPPEYAEEIAAIAVEAFEEAPKWFGIDIMNGAAKIGVNYAEVH